MRKKASTSAKRKTQKERLKELHGILPAGSEPLKNIVHQHARLLLGMRGTDLRSLPLPPTNDERDLAVQRGRSKAFDLDTPASNPDQNHQTHAFKTWIQTPIRSLGLTRFTFDWKSHWKHPFNELMDWLFWRTINMALHAGEYNNYLWSPGHATHAIVSAMLERYFIYLQNEWRSLQKNGEEGLEAKKARNRANKARQRVSQVCDN